MCLCIISLILLIFSYFYDISQDGDRLPFIKSVGWAFLFVLFTASAVTGIDYKTGSTITEVGGITTVTDNFTNYQNRIMFVVFAIVCSIGFTTVLTDIKIPRW